MSVLVILPVRKGRVPVPSALNEFAVADKEGMGPSQVEGGFVRGNSMTSGSCGGRETVKPSVVVQIEVNRTYVRRSRYACVVVDDAGYDTGKYFHPEFAGCEVEDGYYMPFFLLSLCRGE